jgi:hypothetical protein
MGCCDRNRRAAIVAVAPATSTRVLVVSGSQAAPTPARALSGAADRRVPWRRVRAQVPVDARDRTQAVDPRDIVGLVVPGSSAGPDDAPGPDSPAVHQRGVELHRLGVGVQPEDSFQGVGARLVLLG